MSPSKLDRSVKTTRQVAPVRFALLFGLAYLPFIGLGYGTDIDIANILRSGESLFEGNYLYSRTPGALPYEALVGALAPIGGPWLVNLCSAAMAVVVLVLLARIVTDEFGGRAARIAVLIVGTQPWFWVAATSLGDYVFALGLLLGGIDLCRHDRRVLAGVVFATGIGFRSGTVLLVGAYLLAEVIGGRIAPSERRAAWRAVITTGLTTGVVGALWFLPSWLAAGKTSRFLQNEFETTGLSTMIGRWGIKNVAFFGVATIVLLVVRAPVVLAALERWRQSTLVRFAVFASVAAELLFLRFPWKPVHLLPTILAIAVLVAASRRGSSRFVGLLVGSQLLLALVSVTIAEPDVADAATTGHVNVSLTRGVVWNELSCRLNPPYEGAWPDLDEPAADYAAIDVFTCQARSWRAR